MNEYRFVFVKKKDIKTFFFLRTKILCLIFYGLKSKFAIFSWTKNLF